MNKQTRNSTVEALRIVAICLLIMSHGSLIILWTSNPALAPLDNFVFQKIAQPGAGFGVVVFLLISGFYFSPGRVLPKVSTLFFPVVAYSLIFVLLESIVNGSGANLGELIYRLTMFWYFYAYAFYFLMLNFLSRAAKIIKIPTNFVLSTVAAVALILFAVNLTGLLHIDTTDPSPLVVNLFQIARKTVYYFPFLLVGIVLKQSKFHLNRLTIICVGAFSVVLYLKGMSEYSAILIAACIFSLPQTSSLALNRLAESTWSVYLIHQLVFSVLAVSPIIHQIHFPFAYLAIFVLVYAFSFIVHLLYRFSLKYISSNIRKF